jgi:hypothetical protein
VLHVYQSQIVVWGFEPSADLQAPPLVLAGSGLMSGLMSGPELNPASNVLFPISVRGLVVMIVACQVMDPGSIPGERNF